MKAIAVSMVLLTVAPAAAHAACPATSTTKPFRGFGDDAEYSLVPGATFEGSLPGWSIPGAAKVLGNESYKVHSTVDDESLSISPAGLAVTAPFCVSADHPTFRFFARRTSGTWGTALVKVRWSDSGGVHDTVVGSISSTSLWAPTASLPLASVLPLTQPGSTLNVQIVLDPENSGGGFAIDDLYIDPYRK
jgi:hypothetical protein